MNDCHCHHFHYHHQRDAAQSRQGYRKAQASYLRQSHDGDDSEDLDGLEAKRHLLLRRKRLFSHYRQYEQWRRRQFSFDPSYYRTAPTALSTPPANILYDDYSTTYGVRKQNAFRRRRQYHRQYSYNERSYDSQDSRESCPLHKCHQHSMAAGSSTTPPPGGIRTDSSIMLNYKQVTNDCQSCDSVQCGAAAALVGYQPLHLNTRHFYAFQEEPSTSIAERITRNRINSAIFASSEGRGFDSIEFLRRHGSQSVLCRKAKSAENITNNNNTTNNNTNAKGSTTSSKRKWPTEFRQQQTETNAQQSNENSIELQECSKSFDRRPLATLKSSVEKLLAATTPLLGHTAAVTTSNKVIGSIYLEALPSHLRETDNSEEPAQTSASKATHTTTTITTTTTTTITTVTSTTSISTTSTTISGTTNTSIIKTSSTPCKFRSAGEIQSNSNALDTAEARSQKTSMLTRQRSLATASSIPSSMQSCSPKLVPLKYVLPKMQNVPMVSISGPSPQDEHPPPAQSMPTAPGECL